jgi:hypothetical protein
MFKPRLHHHAEIDANPLEGRDQPMPKSMQTHVGRPRSTHVEIGANPRWKAEINPRRDRRANPTTTLWRTENRGRAQRREGKKMEER